MTVETPDLGRKTLGGTFWSYAAFYTGKLLVFISTIILARLLSQDDFGVAGYALVVINFLEVFRDLGVGSALIYHPRDDDTSSTAFWLGLGISLALFLLTWLAGPWVGWYFNDPRAVPVTRWLALSFPLSALGNVHNILLSKELQFRRKFVPEFVKSLGKGLISIALALLGFGAYSLIIGQLAGTFFAVLAYWWSMPWRPAWRFSRQKAGDLVGYGVHIVANNFLSIIQTNTDYLLIGRYLGPALLGVYSLAFRIPELLVMQFCNIVSQVIFPVYTRMRNEPGALQRGFLVATRYLTLITVPLGVGVALVAEPLVLFVFTDKWADAIPVLRAISIYTLMISLSYNAGDIYKAEGRPSVLTRLSLLGVLVEVPALFWAVLVPGTIAAVGWTLAVTATLLAALEMAVAGHMLKTPLRKILQAIAPAFLSSAAMALVVLAVLAVLQATPSVVQLLAGATSGVLTYAGVLWFFQRELARNTLGVLRKLVRRQGPLELDDPSL